MNESKSNRVLKLEEHRTVQGKEYCPCRCHQKTLGDFMEITDEYAEEVFEIFERLGSYKLPDGTWRTRAEDLEERIENSPSCTCNCKH